jgi:hypothetical protein
VKLAFKGRALIGTSIGGLFAIATALSDSDSGSRAPVVWFILASALGGGIAGSLVHALPPCITAPRASRYARFGLAGACGGAIAGLPEVAYGETASSLGLFAFLGLGVGLSVAVYASILLSDV